MPSTYRGWTIRHDPLPLPKPHNEWEATPPTKLGWAMRAASEAELREIIDRLEAYSDAA